MTTTGRDLSHYNAVSDYAAARGATDWVHIKITESTSYTDPMAAQHHAGFQGIPRGAYHFARPGNLAGQIAHFLAVKAQLGAWERLDMLDCEFAGVDAAFIKALMAEYRRQSGVWQVYVYVGLHDLTGACNPSGWWDQDLLIWASRYRKIGAPSSPDAWAQHLGWDHPGLTTYQWDNATALAGAGLTDISQERSVVSGEADAQVVFAQTQRYKNTNRQVADDWIDSRVYGERNAAKLDAALAKLDALGSALSDDEANILAAFRAASAVDVGALAAALGPQLATALGPLLGRVPDEQIAQLVEQIPEATKRLLAAALASGTA